MNQLFENHFGLVMVTTVFTTVLAIISGLYAYQSWYKPTPGLAKIGSRISFLWWTLAIFVLAILYSYKILIFYIWLMAFLALKEFLSMTPTRRADRRVLFFAYLALPIQFILILLHQKDLFVVFVPIHVFLVLPIIMVLSGETKGFLQAWALLGWGIITTVYSLGFLAYLLVLPVAKSPTVGGSGLFLFLVGLAQLNHAAQYVFGKRLSSPQLSLKVSTTRNWASLFGSMVVSIPAAMILAPWLTPFAQLEAALMGALIAIGAFIGYIILSAIKGDLQFKDRGTMTPGRGGILNRIDTFIYTAPLFYYLVHLLHFG